VEDSGVVVNRPALVLILFVVDMAREKGRGKASLYVVEY